MPSSGVTESCLAFFFPPLPHLEWLEAVDPVCFYSKVLHLLHLRTIILLLEP